MVGNARIQDERGGDAGSIYKKPAIFPSVFFMRSSFVAPQSSTMSHPELMGAGKALKQYFITTSLGVSYHNDFEVEIYNIRRPSKSAVLMDFTYDYFQKVIAQRRVNAKKKQEKTLASLVKSLAQTDSSAVPAEDPDKALELMRSNAKDPAKRFKTPYQITCTCYSTAEDERQSLAVGLLDGAILILDLALGLEKFFVEKHPSAVTALAFFEERILISGSVDGRVNLCDLDSQDQERVYKCQNVQDTKIPIASVSVGDFGIGVAVDIEGNCRFYDFYRLRKLCKISAKANVALKQPGG